jgi:hypothetical protein
MNSDFVVHINKEDLKDKLCPFDEYELTDIATCKSYCMNKGCRFLSQDEKCWYPLRQRNSKGFI